MSVASAIACIRSGHTPTKSELLDLADECERAAQHEAFWQTTASHQVEKLDELRAGAAPDEAAGLRAALDRSTRELAAAEADRDRWVERVRLLESRIAGARVALASHEGHPAMGHKHAEGKL